MTKPKLTLSHLEYIFRHCIPRGCSNFKYAIITWYKLIRGDYSDYLIYCQYNQRDETQLFDIMRRDFWDLLEDDVLDKETYDLVMQRAYEVETGQVETFPWKSINIEEITSK